MKTNIGIKEKDLSAIAKALNVILADEHVLYMKTRNAHWNVEGPNFHAQHLFFESQYQELQDMIDDLAERIRSIGHFAVATLKQYLQITHLAENEKPDNDGLTFIRDLLSDHEMIIMHIRSSIEDFEEKYEDSGTSDFITGLMEKHEKMAWMLRAHFVK